MDGRAMLDEYQNHCNRRLWSLGLVDHRVALLLQGIQSSWCD
ncbi:hypothetical protein D777_03109 [Marinobacter nitratireducens]|uniref:Uncharacterized protein n=1 Tax=Marinobacter nitratireducens TaxID=1137280 RepID=A0A072MYX5_9GAMM|nr:hypothetical protein D777_03109 [Marinobacter nitratireducens]